MTHAMGIGASAAVGLAINDAEGEEYNNTKNIADGLMAERGVLGALLAKRGFTGPERIIEGNKGFAHSLLRGIDNYRPEAGSQRLLSDAHTNEVFSDRIDQPGTPFRDRRNWSRDHDLKPEDIEEMMLRLSKRTVEPQRRPGQEISAQQGNGADHSAYFITALGIVLRGKCRAIVFHRCGL